MLADMIATAKITSKGQTTIPQSIRDALHIKPGDRVIWEVSAAGEATMRRAEPAAQSPEFLEECRRQVALVVAAEASDRDADALMDAAWADLGATE